MHPDWLPFAEEPEGKKGLGLIGYPLSHSFSGRFFAEKFEKEGIGEYYYALFPLPEIRLLPELFQRFPALMGLNVTIPYKKLVIPFLDGLTAEAAAVGAVNVIRKTPEGNLLGYNSDIYGFGDSLSRFLFSGDDAEVPTEALVLGNGGAALAVVYQLQQMGIHPTVVSRNPGPKEIGYGALDAGQMQRNRLIVQTTPLGMVPHPDAAPDIPYSLLTPRHFLYDLIYNPPSTLFLERGKAMGARTANGADMLVLQALKSWEIWTSPPATHSLAK